jgi:tyrosine-protein kinase
VIRIAETLSRRWWLLLLFSIIGVGGAYYLDTYVPSRFQSTVSLQLNPAARSSFLPYLAEAATTPASSPVIIQAASYRELLRSRAFGQVIVQQLGLAVPPDAIAAAISAQLVPNTNILHVSVTWDNPRDAEQLAQRIAELFIAENQRRQQSQPGTQTQLAQMEQSARDIQSRLDPLQQQRDRLDQAVARGDLSRLNELSALDTRLSGLESSYADLLVETSRIRSSFDTAVIVDNATPAYPLDALPLVQAFVFGLLGGLGLAVCLVLLVERLADVVRTPRDVALIAALPLLARIPHARTWGWRRLLGQPRQPIVVLERGSPPAAEAVRSLRAALRLLEQSPPLRSLIVTSGGRADGKTYVACNLSVALAQGGDRVLLVDGNLRHPAVHQWFGVANTAGLCGAIARAPVWSKDSADSVPGAIESSVPNLWLLPAGTLSVNPGELLISDVLGWVFERLSALWDIVIVDTPPIGRVTDALLLARHASSCIVVARSGHTKRGALRGALAALETGAEPVLGVVLDDERAGRLARFRYDEHFHYGYWSEPGSGQFEEEVVSRANGHSLATSWSPTPAEGDMQESEPESTRRSTPSPRRRRPSS